MIASSIRLETPEGIDLDVRPAGPVARGLALLVDGTITQGLSVAIFLAALFAGTAGIGVYLVAAFVIEWFYPVLFEVFDSGQTPGKRWLGLRVVSRDATPIGWNASLLRNLLRTVDFFPFFYMTGFVSMLMSDRFQRLGDLAAGSMVVHTRWAEFEVADPDPGQLEGLGSRVSSVPLGPADQRALLAYSERQSTLSAERAAELADVLAPLVGTRGEEGRREVLRIANGLAGRS